MKTQTAIAALLVAASGAIAQAETFEIVEPGVEQGEIELEILTAVALDDVGVGDERSSHEIAIGYGVTDFWKATLGVELGNERGEGLEVEGFEFENVFSLIGGDDDDDDDDDGEAASGLTGFALYAALEVPEDEGFDEAELAVGPIAEFGAGALTLTGNLFVEIPFEDGEDPGLIYAVSAVAEVTEGVGVGVEAHGEIEEAFGDDSEHALFIGPALYGEIEAGDEAEIGARLALLFGVDEAETDVALSFNLEFEF